MFSFPTSVLIADDGSPEAGRAIEAAVGLALATGSALSLVHVKSLAPSVAGTTVTPTQMERLREQGEALVARRREEVSARGLELEHAEVRLGRRIETTVVRAATDLGAGLLVVGARGGGTGHRHVLGDLSVRLVRDARCSVLVVRAEEGREPSPSPTGRQPEGTR